GWEATGQPWQYDAERYAQVAAAREREQRAMLDYLTTTGCRMEFLRRQLDDPAAAPCGRCDNCAGWSWPATISDGARAAAGERLPQMIESLADRLARVGRLRALGRVEYARPHGGSGGSQNSAQRLRALWDRFHLPPPVAAALPSLDGPVLLVDDRIDTGWTMTVAARLLRQAGAPAVL